MKYTLLLFTVLLVSITVCGECEPSPEPKAFALAAANPEAYPYAIADAKADDMSNPKIFIKTKTDASANPKHRRGKSGCCRKASKTSKKASCCCKSSTKKQNHKSCKKSKKKCRRCTRREIKPPVCCGQAQNPTGTNTINLENYLRELIANVSSGQTPNVPIAVTPSAGNIPGQIGSTSSSSSGAAPIGMITSPSGSGSNPNTVTPYLIEDTLITLPYTDLVIVTESSSTITPTEPSIVSPTAPPPR